MSYEWEREVAVAAVLEAAALCQAVRAERVTVEAVEKGDKSPVTIADLGSQALVCRALKEAFPDDPIVAEEDAAALRRPESARRLAEVTDYVRRFHAKATAAAVCDWIDAGKGHVAGRFWTLDPIDGTKGFLRDDQYAVALALIEGGAVQVAVLGCPALPLALGEPDGARGVLFVAVRGLGAAMAAIGSDEWRPIHVSRAGGAAQWRFVESVEAGHGDHERQAAVARAVGISRPSLRMDSQAKYGAVARGDAALYLRLPSPTQPDYREKIWDHAAGSLIVEEAGGRVTDMHGHPLDLASAERMAHNRGVIVSNGVLHEAVLRVLG